MSSSPPIFLPRWPMDKFWIRFLLYGLVICQLGSLAVLNWQGGRIAWLQRQVVDMPEILDLQFQLRKEVEKCR